jgi:hypothetical protein
MRLMGGLEAFVQALRAALEQSPSEEGPRRQCHRSLEWSRRVYTRSPVCVVKYLHFSADGEPTSGENVGTEMTPFTRESLNS